LEPVLGVSVEEQAKTPKHPLPTSRMIEVFRRSVIDEAPIASL
jgi:hypothetical protein